MSIDHKAYLFRFGDFEAELADVLYEALASDSVRGLREFINEYHGEMIDPETEEPYGSDWEQAFIAGLTPSEAVQVYGDIALTKYYDLTDIRGLSYGFDALGEYLRTVPHLSDVADLLICGYLFGPKGRRFDPGYMGTGMLPADEVVRLRNLLERPGRPPIPEPTSPLYAGCYYKPDSVKDVQESFDRLLALYRSADAEGTGLLFADFNDRGVRRV